MLEYQPHYPTGPMSYFPSTARALALHSFTGVNSSRHMITAYDRSVFRTVTLLNQCMVDILVEGIQSTIALESDIRLSSSGFQYLGI